MGVPKRLPFDVILDRAKNSVNGTATVANGETDVTVTHGYYKTPNAYQLIITPTNNMGNASQFFLTDVGSTSFKINVDSDPGATTATFVWSIL